MQFGKWRVLKQAVSGEQNHLADLAPDAVMIALLLEISAKALLADIGLDRQRIHSFPRISQSDAVEVGGENLHFPRHAVPRRFFREQHRQGIGLFPARATGRPYPDRSVLGIHLEQLRENLLGEGVEGLRIAEKRRYRDQQIVEQALQLLRAWP